MAYNNYSREDYGRDYRGRGDGRIEFRVAEHIGVIGINDKNQWRKEVNFVSWNGGDPKIDIREWDPDHIRMAKGITLHEKEAVRLTRMLCRRYGMEDMMPAAPQPTARADEAQQAPRAPEAGLSACDEPGAEDSGPAINPGPTLLLDPEDEQAGADDPFEADADREDTTALTA